MAVLQSLRRQLIGSKSAASVFASLLPGLSVLLAFAGVAWLFVLPLEDQSRRTYISENALLPGQALTYFHGSEENIVRAFREEVRLLSNASEEVRSQTIKQWIRDMGYKSATHNWSISHFDDTKSGVNAYGVLHAPRGDTTESMVLCAPWINGDGVLNEGGVAIAISLARYLARWSIWSKDIILLIPSDAGFGLSKWIEDYHYVPMPVSSGSIQGGVVIDFPGESDRFDYLDVVYEGLNGQLPNLDLINTVVLVAGHMNIKVSIHDITESTDNYETRVTTLLTGIAHQALSGLYSSGSGSEAFSGWRIDAVTLRARASSDGDGTYDQMLFGRLVEATVRSINNLLEHFHQSFFFYLLLSPKRFVSIGTYLPSAMLIGASFTIKGISFWLKSVDSKTGGSFEQAVRSFGLFSLMVFGSVAVFAVVASTPSKDLSTLVYTIAALTACFPVLIRAVLLEKPFSYVNQLRSYALIYTGLILTTLCTINFSLALGLGLIFFPLAHLLRPSVRKSQSPKGQQFIYATISHISIILTCPWLVIFLYFLLSVCTLEFPESSISLSFLSNLILGDLSQQFNQFLSDMMWNWRALGIWSFMPVLFVVWLPLWMISCLVVSVPVDDDGRNTTQKSNDSVDIQGNVQE